MIHYTVPSWMENNLKIVDRDGRIASLYLNTAQRMLHKTIEDIQISQGYPVRIIVLKARRHGISTYTEARFFREINHRAHVNAVVASADIASTNKVFGMAKRFQKSMPANLKKPTDFSNRKEIVYSEPWGSAFIAQTAGTDVLGRGGQNHYFHPTEFAFWKDAKTQFGGAMQEVPDKDSMVIIESTANGVGGAFHDMFMEALDDWKCSRSPGNFLPIFLPWFIFPEYKRKIPLDMKFQPGVPHASNIPLEWLEEEKELIAKFSLTDEQLYWRRWAIKNKCQNDLNLFHQEYPWCWEVAFTSTGRNVFLHSKVDAMPTKDGHMAILEKRGDRIQAESTETLRNCWQIWKKPVQGHSYTIGIDTMEGTQSDPDDPKSNYDFHAVSVFDRDTGEVVAIYLGRGGQRELGIQCVYAAKWYNEAWIAPELPMGMVVLDVLKESGYDKIYQRQMADEQRVESDSLNLGWRTTILTRPKMVDDFKTAFSEGDIKIYSKDLTDEMRTFVYDKHGTPRHRPGKHDDLLFATMIALQLHVRLPFHSIPYPCSDTFGSEDFEPFEEDDLSMRNCVDWWDGDIEEEYEMYTD
jgi:hypothetical protein